MVKLSTEKLSIQGSRDGNYRVDNRPGGQKVNAIGNWRKRPKGRRLFTAEEIRAIRISTAKQRHLAELYDCSHVLIYYIKKRAIYADVI